MHFKGVNWNPIRRGGDNPEDLNYRGFAAADAELMSLAGINVVRTYDAIIDKEVLDVFWSHGIHVLSTVYINAQEDLRSIDPKVLRAMNHPAVLMWVLGNEWNLNGLYQGLPYESARDLVASAARRVRALDPSRPIATIYGGLPDVETLFFFGDDIDVWGTNQYEELSFGNLFAAWARLPTSKPMFLGEYGADAFNTVSGREDQPAQAEATRRLTREIVGNSSAGPGGGVCIGGFIFEFADEWWKSGSPSSHDVKGPGRLVTGSVYPDRKFNEEWWGLVTYDGTQRLAFQAFAAIAAPGCAAGSREPGCGRKVSKATPGYRMRACGQYQACGNALGNCCPDDSGVRHGCCPPETPWELEPREMPLAAPAGGRRPPSSSGRARPAEEHWHNPVSAATADDDERGAGARSGPDTADGEVQAAAATEGVATEAPAPGRPKVWACETTGFYFRFVGPGSWPEDKRRYCCERMAGACGPPPGAEGPESETSSQGGGIFWTHFQGIIVILLGLCTICGLLVSRQSFRPEEPCICGREVMVCRNVEEKGVSWDFFADKIPSPPGEAAEDEFQFHERRPRGLIVPQDILACVDGAVTV